MWVGDCEHYDIRQTKQSAQADAAEIQECRAEGLHWAIARLALLNRQRTYRPRKRSRSCALGDLFALWNYFSSHSFEQVWNSKVSRVRVQRSATDWREHQAKNFHRHDSSATSQYFPKLERRVDWNHIGGQLSQVRTQSQTILNQVCEGAVEKGNVRSQN